MRSENKLSQNRGLGPLPFGIAGPDLMSMYLCGIKVWWSLRLTSGSLRYWTTTVVVSPKFMWRCLHIILSTCCNGRDFHAWGQVQTESTIKVSAVSPSRLSCRGWDRKGNTGVETCSGISIITFKQCISGSGCRDQYDFNHNIPAPEGVYKWHSMWWNLCHQLRKLSRHQY